MENVKYPNPTGRKQLIAGNRNIQFAARETILTK